MPQFKKGSNYHYDHGLATVCIDNIGIGNYAGHNAPPERRQINALPK